MSSRPLRVAVVAACPFPFPRGTPIRILRLTEALARRGHEAHVVTYHLGERTESLPFRVHRIARVPTYRKVSAGPTYQKLLLLDALLARRLWRLLAERRFDVIHAHHYEGLLVGAWCGGSTRTPVVFDVHTLLESELPFYPLGLFHSVKRGLGGYLDARLPGRADHAIAVTDGIKQRLVALGALPETEVSVIPNGVEVEHFRRAGDLPAADAAATLVFAGNLSPYQGIEPMLQALARLVGRREALRLRCVTNDSFAPYEGLARSLGVRERIDVVRSTFESLPRELGRGHAALNPRVECAGIPQKLLNYLAAGRPVVSFRGSAKGIVDEEQGLIVDDGDVAAFAAAIERVLDTPTLAERLSRNARDYAIRELSWDGAARRTERVYRRLLGRRVRGRA